MSQATGTAPWEAAVRHRRKVAATDLWRREEIHLHSVVPVTRIKSTLPPLCGAFTAIRRKLLCHTVLTHNYLDLQHQNCTSNDIFFDYFTAFVEVLRFSFDSYSCYCCLLKCKMLCTQLGCRSLYLLDSELYNSGVAHHSLTLTSTVHKTQMNSSAEGFPTEPMLLRRLVVGKLPHLVWPVHSLLQS